MASLLILFSAVFGALIGSFLNVVIWRVPRKESLVHPPSRCPHCGHAIRPYDNVPIFGWLLLRGKCRDCGAPISPRYPIVETGTTLAFGLVAWWFTSTQDAAASPLLIIALVAFLYLAAISIALALIDIDVYKLPNAIVLPAYPVLIVLLGATSLLTNDPGALLRAAIGGAALFAFYFIAAFIYPNGMGFGDVKLAGVLGFASAWLGWGQFAVGAFAPFLLGGVFGVVLLIARKAGRKSRIPFGPWMLGGAWIGIIVGEPIAHWYLVLVGLA